jgi:HAD superfamily hydrolase (TIGR01493 family)
MELQLKYPIQVVAFDLFGTVFDVSQVPREELQHYGDTIRKSTWEPFVWPAAWERMPPFPDSRDGLLELHHNGYFVVALSNAPLALAMRMIKNAHLHFDAIIPLEAQRIYKPRTPCYTFARQLLGVSREEFLMVSANKHFGDLEAAQSLGMQAQLIRHEGHPATITELADLLPDLRPPAV